MRQPRYDTNPIAPVRLQALADGVFAIAMTLLVFQLTVPVAAEVGEEGGLGRAFRDLWPEFLAYVLSFLVLGVFWLIHHMLFDAVERYDSTLVWLNVGYLMVAALIPYSTALVQQHGPETVTALVYGVNMLLGFDFAWAIHTYCTRGNRLVAEEYDPDLARGVTLMGVVYTIAMFVPLAVSFVSPELSFVLYGAFVTLFISLTMLGRWDVVAVLPARSDDA